MESFRISESNQMRQGPELQQKVISEKPANKNLRDGKAVAETLTKMHEKTTEKPENEKPDVKEIEKAVATINKSLKDVNTEIKINFDEASGKKVINLINSESGETIRKIPPDSVLKLSARISEYLGEWPENETITEGAVIDKKV